MLQSTLDEARRREYLAALGVPLFVARRVLPGAAASETWLVPVVIERVAAQPALQGALASVMARVTPRLVLPEIVAQVLAPPAAPVALIAVTAASAPPPRFACRLMPIGEHGFVLLDLGQFPDVVAGEVLNLPPAEQQLWRNLQRALAWYPGEPEPDFIWPRAVKGMLGDDAETARDMLSAWLQRQIQSQARLWVFGDDLAAFVTRTHFLLPSLSALLASPLAKRQLWQLLSQELDQPLSQASSRL